MSHYFYWRRPSFQKSPADDSLHLIVQNWNRWPQPAIRRPLRWIQICHWGMGWPWLPLLGSEQWWVPSPRRKENGQWANGLGLDFSYWETPTSYPHFWEADGNLPSHHSPELTIHCCPKPPWEECCLENKNHPMRTIQQESLRPPAS